MGTGRGCWVQSSLSSFSSFWGSRSKIGVQGYRVWRHEVMGRRQSFCSFHELQLALPLPPPKTSVSAEAQQAG